MHINSVINRGINDQPCSLVLYSQVIGPPIASSPLLPVAVWLVHWPGCGPAETCSTLLYRASHCWETRSPFPSHTSHYYSTTITLAMLMIIPTCLSSCLKCLVIFWGGWFISSITLHSDAFPRFTFYREQLWENTLQYKTTEKSSIQVCGQVTHQTNMVNEPPLLMHQFVANLSLLPLKASCLCFDWVQTHSWNSPLC